MKTARRAERRAPGGVAVLSIAALAALGCRRPAAEPAEIRIGHEAAPVSLDPVRGVDSVSKSLLANLYDPLVDWDGRLKPAVARSWSNPDERTWVFSLRPGVRVHDGSLLTAADVRFSLERARSDPASALADRLATIESVEVVDDLTLRVRTREPDPHLLYRMTDVFVAPRAAASSLGERPVGTGAYRFARRSGDVLELEAFRGHWRGDARIRTARFLPLVSGDETAAALRQGRVDVVRWVPEARVAEVESLPGVRVVARASLRVMYLWMRSAKPHPFADRRVRQAVSLAIDRAELVRRLGGHALPLEQFVPTGVAGRLTPAPPLPHDREAAKKLLGEAGYPHGFETSMTYVAGAEPVADAVREQLGEVGIKLLPDRRDWTRMLPDWQAARLPLFLASWWFSSGEPSMFTKECLFTRDARAPTGWNPGYSNEELDRLIALDFRTFGDKARGERLAAVMRLLLDEMPLVPLFSRYDLYALRSGIRWSPRLDGKMLAAEMGAEAP